MTHNNNFEQDLDRVLGDLKSMLMAKNKAYGDSALNPVRIFSKASTSEQILVRLDDKLSRIAKGSSAGEDVILDILGYLIIYRILYNREINDRS